MRCKNCPAYWEDRDYEYGVQERGCYCNPEAGNDAMREFADGNCGCNRKLPYIKKIMAKVEQEKELEMKFRAIPLLHDSIIHYIMFFCQVEYKKIEQIS